MIISYTNNIVEQYNSAVRTKVLNTTVEYIPGEKVLFNEPYIVQKEVQNRNNEIVKILSAEIRHHEYYKVNYWVLEVESEKRRKMSSFNSSKRLC